MVHWFEKQNGESVGVPLLLTLSRVFLGPLFLVIYLYGKQWGIEAFAWALVLLALTIMSELSDAFDGALARKRNKVTELGKLLDPMADSVFRLSVFLAFSQGAVGVPLVLVALFFYRDLLISTLRSLCALRGVALAARLSGKVKAVIQAVAIFFILLLMIPYGMGSLSLERLQAFSFYAVLVAAVYTIYSGIEYFFANRIHVKRAFGMRR